MLRLFTRIRNSDFHASDKGVDYEDAGTALAQGVQSAAALMIDEIGRGKTSAAVEVSIEEADGVQLLCSIVAISVSSLITRAQKHTVDKDDVT